MNTMVFKYAFIVPGLICLLGTCTFILTYSMSVIRKDVRAVIPYISDTGNWAPESCYFGQSLNIEWVLMSFVFYVRYRYVRYLDEINTFKPIVKDYNVKGFYFGLLSAFGASVVANFQETNLFSIHLVGAILCFGFGCVYEYFQVRISFEIYPVAGNKIVNICRAFCFAVCAITSQIAFVFGTISLMQYEGEDHTKWAKSEYGFKNHFISAVAEWILGVFYMMFVSSFIGEFKSITIKEPEFNIEEKWAT